MNSGIWRLMKRRYFGIADILMDLKKFVNYEKV